MSRHCRPLFTVFFCGLIFAAVPAAAQQVTIATPFQRTGERFFESTNIGWSFNVGGVSARFGGSNVAAPPFGGFNPAAGVSGGGSFRRGDFNGNLNFNFAQGSHRSFTTVAPMLTLTNGHPGFLFIGSERAFVTGVVPIVGNGAAPLFPEFAGFNGFNAVQPPFLPAVQPPQLPPQFRMQPALLAKPKDPVDEHAVRLVEDADLADQPVIPRTVDPAPPSRTSLRLQQEAEAMAKAAEAHKHLQRGREAERNGKPQVAKHYYRLAARAADGELKDTILAELGRLEQK